MLHRDTGTNCSAGSMSIPMHFAHLLGLGLTIVSIATFATGFLSRSSSQSAMILT